MIEKALVAEKSGIMKNGWCTNCIEPANNYLFWP